MNSETSQKPKSNIVQAYAPYLSIIIPGSGQVIQKRTWRGITILLFAFVLGFLVNWAYVNYKIGKIQISDEISFNWLLIPLCFILCLEHI